MKISVLSAFFLCALLITGCASKYQYKVTMLKAAGFRTIVPTTPEQISQLKTLRQHKVTPVVKNGATSFIYADAGLNLLLIGGEKQYQQYQQYKLQHKIREQQEETAALNANSTAWSCWGGGFWGPGFY
jgi:hypothetical protein